MTTANLNQRHYSQRERFVVFWGPAVVLGLGGVLPLLVAQVGADDEDLHERTEDPLSLPTQVVGSHHCERRREEGVERAAGLFRPFEILDWTLRRSPNIPPLLPLTVTLCSPVLG